MQKGFSVILILIGILVLGLVSGGAYYLGKSQNSQPKSQSQAVSQTPTPSPDASREPNGSAETANWKTYKNSKYGHQISYPTGEVWFDEENSQHRDLVQSVGINIGDIGDYKNTINLSVSVWKDLGIRIQDIFSREKWCSLIESQLVKEEYSQIGCSYGAQFTETMVHKVKAFKTTGGRDNSFVSVFYIPNKGYVYQIEITTGRLSEDGKVDFPLSNQILSTFKFTQ